MDRKRIEEVESLNRDATTAGPLAGRRSHCAKALDLVGFVAGTDAEPGQKFHTLWSGDRSEVSA